MSAVVVDDACLRSILLADQTKSLKSALRNREVYTTGAWLYRLAQAIRDPTIRGILSGPVAALSPELQEGIVQQLIELPSEIGILSGRELAWTMAGLVQRHRLNYLALEALATAVVLGAPVVFSEGLQPPLLVAACSVEKVRVILIG
jgi:hypothetical protein